MATWFARRVCAILVESVPRGASVNYTVPKVSIKVKAVMTAGAPHAGGAYLAETARDHAGPQRLEDMLNESEPFFAIAHARGFSILNKRNLLYLTTSDRVEMDYYRNLTSLVRREDVAMSLRGRKALRGTILIEMPEGMARVQDYLNSGRAFLPLLVGRELALVNTASIVSIRLVDGRPAGRSRGRRK